MIKLLVPIFLILTLEVFASDVGTGFDRVLSPTRGLKIFKGVDVQGRKCTISVSKKDGQVLIVAELIEYLGQKISSEFKIDNNNYILEDMLDDSFGLEVHSRYYSPEDIRLDTKTSVIFEEINGEVDLIKFSQKQYGTIFWKTIFKLGCEIE